MIGLEEKPTPLLLSPNFLAIFAPALAAREYQARETFNAATGLSQVFQRIR
jgi:hypothetical protein